VVFAQPGFQHQKQSRTNGLAHQHQHNAKTQKTMPEKQESVLAFMASATHRLHRACCQAGVVDTAHLHAWEAIAADLRGHKRV
jgi:hypothetical protein